MCRRLYGEPKKGAHHQLGGPLLFGLGADRKSVWMECAKTVLGSLYVSCHNAAVPNQIETRTYRHAHADTKVQ